MTRRSGKLALAVLTLLTVGLGPGCAIERPALSSRELEARKEAQLGYLRRYNRLVSDRLVRRMTRESDAAGPGGVADIDILIISGGGDYGAFGAGLLQGWGAIADPVQARPDFDIVTGVSTGALIAPFAFIGTSPQYGRLASLYSSPKKEWFVSRGLLKLLFGAESYMDTSGLRRELDQQIDESTIAEIAAGERQDRTLWIGATNLDLGVLYPWDLTLEARRITDAPCPEGAPSLADRMGESGACCSRLRDVLLASAAIPAVFPPVVIDSTLYVDGGATSNIFFDLDLLQAGGPVERFRAERPGRPVPRFRFWVIINNKIGVDGAIVQPTWLSITKASIATAIRSSTLGSLKQLETLAELHRCKGLSAEFRYVCIPDDWRPPKDDPEPFDPDLMRSLLELGRRMGETGGSWRAGLKGEMAETTGG